MGTESPEVGVIHPVTGWFVEKETQAAVADVVSVEMSLICLAATHPTHHTKCITCYSARVGLACQNKLIFLGRDHIYLLGVLLPLLLCICELSLQCVYKTTSKIIGESGAAETVEPNTRREAAGG